MHLWFIVSVINILLGDIFPIVIGFFGNCRQNNIRRTLPNGKFNKGHFKQKIKCSSARKEVGRRATSWRRCTYRSAPSATLRKATAPSQTSFSLRTCTRYRRTTCWDVLPREDLSLSVLTRSQPTSSSSLTSLPRLKKKSS